MQLFFDQHVNLGAFNLEPGAGLDCSRSSQRAIGQPFSHGLLDLTLSADPNAFQQGAQIQTELFFDARQGAQYGGTDRDLAHLADRDVDPAGTRMEHDADRLSARPADASVHRRRASHLSYELARFIASDRYIGGIAAKSACARLASSITGMAARSTCSRHGRAPPCTPRGKPALPCSTL